MPSIPIYNAPTTPIEIPNRGVEALATAGRRVGQLGDEQASAVRQGGEAIERGLNATKEMLTQHQTSQDLINGGEQYAATNANLAEQWRQFSNDPANAKDPNLAQKFQEEVVAPAVDGMQEGFHTPESQRWAALHGGELAEHWQNITTEDQAKIAGVNAQASFLNTINTNSDAIATDPRQLPIAIRNTETQIDALAQTGQYTPEQIAKLRGEGMVEAKRVYTLAAIKGKIDADPTADVSNILKPNGKYLNPADHAEINGYQRTQQEVQLREQNAVREQAKRDQTAAVQQQTTQLTASLFANGNTPTVGPGYFAGIRDLMANASKYPLVDVRTQADAMIKLGDTLRDRQASGKDVPDDPAAVKTLSDNLYNTANPTTREEVDNSIRTGHLSINTWKNLRRSAEDQEKHNDPAINTAINANLDQVQRLYGLKNVNAMGIVQPDPDKVWGGTAYSIFRGQFDPALSAARANGTVNAFLTPGKPEYWGNYINISAIAREAQGAPLQLQNVKQSGGPGANGLVAAPGTTGGTPAVAAPAKRSIGSYFGFGQ